MVGGGPGRLQPGHSGDCHRAAGHRAGAAGGRLLQEAVAKRYGQSWPILREGEEQASHKTLVILGQRSTCARLDELCRKQGIELSETAPGFDGYVIVPVTEGGRLLIVVGGCNARGVEYGQDTLFQMLRGSSENLGLVRGVVRDAPVVPWRGRPQTSVRHYLRPGELDLVCAGAGELHRPAQRHLCLPAGREAGQGGHHRGAQAGASARD